MKTAWMKYSLFLAVYVFSAAALARENKESTKRTTITLDGETTFVYFSDGDTFKVLDGAYKGDRVRVVGYNSLEAYGPVHQWGTSTPAYLFQIARRATRVAQNSQWTCVLEAGQDVFGRRLATCDDLAQALIKEGFAHVYSIDDEPAKETYRALQQEAQKAEVGMWKYGKPDFIITSLHSANEKGKRPYNRLISTVDGHTKKWYHQKTYATCEKICLEEASCMIYVPYEQRYGANRPDCLLMGKS